MLSIVIGTDEFGSKPFLLRDGDPAPAGRMRWRLVAQTDDETIAGEVMQLLYRRCFEDRPPAVI